MFAVLDMSVVSSLLHTHRRRCSVHAFRWRIGSRTVRISLLTFKKEVLVTCVGLRQALEAAYKDKTAPSLNGTASEAENATAGAYALDVLCAVNSWDSGQV
jgi:hypothetical protein